MSLVIVCGTTLSFFLFPTIWLSSCRWLGSTPEIIVSWLVLNFQHVTSWPIGTQGCLCMYCLPRCIIIWSIYIYIYIHIYYELNAITEYRDRTKLLLQGVHFTPRCCFDVNGVFITYYVAGFNSIITLRSIWNISNMSCFIGKFTIG